MRPAAQIRRFFGNLLHRDQLENVLSEELEGYIFPHEMSLVIKTKQSAATLAPSIERAAIEAKTDRAAFEIRPMSDYVADSIGDTRFVLLVLAAFAVSCVLLASVGLYGTLAYLISQRTREFGIRMALGSGIPAIVGMVVREGALLAGTGAAVGLVGALAVAGAIRQLLYDSLRSTDVGWCDLAARVGVIGSGGVAGLESRPYRSERLAASGLMGK